MTALDAKLIELKYCLYERLGVLSVLLILGSAVCAWFLEPSKALSVMAGALGVSGAALKQRGDDSKATLDAFRNFNERYQALDQALHNKEPSAIQKYVDLCAEEYWMYRQGLIPPAVWKAWKAGMAAIREESPSLDEVEKQNSSSLYEFSFAQVLGPLHKKKELP